MTAAARATREVDHLRVGDEKQPESKFEKDFLEKTEQIRKKIENVTQFVETRCDRVTNCVDKCTDDLIKLTKCIILVVAGIILCKSSRETFASQANQLMGVVFIGAAGVKLVTSLLGRR